MSDIIEIVVFGIVSIGGILIYAALDLLNTKLNKIMEKLEIKKDEEP
jgi:hypothetical protein